MKIGYDAKRIVNNATGLGNYGRTLVNDMAETVPGGDLLYLYTPCKGKDSLVAEVSKSHNIHWRLPRKVMLSKKLLSGYWRSFGIVDDMKFDGINLFHGLSGELPIGIKKSGIASVVTIHDLIFLRHPEYYNPIDVQIYKWKFHKTCAEADRIIAISECTKRDIMHFGNVSGERIDVVYQSCDRRYTETLANDYLQKVKLSHNLPDRFVLTVGTIEKRKNLKLIVEAMTCGVFPRDVHLVAVGRTTKYASEVARFAEDNRLSDRVTLLSGIDNKTLQALYQLASCFAYPSRYEGFGIPVIEAIQSGLPVIAAKGSCLEEAGGPHSLYVSPDDATEFAEAVARLLDNEEDRQQRVFNSRQYVHRFEGTNVAAQVYDVYRKLL